MLRLRPILIALVPILVAALATPPTQAARSLAGPAAATGPASGARPLHRVVWDDDATRRGIHLRSADLDGSHQRDLYDAPRGFTLELSLDRAGRRVAFAPCCRDSFPALVIVPVLGGRALKPLARHHAISFAGGIGWSPDGRRLAFEGSIRTARRVVTSLWTIRPDGHDLHHVLTLPPPTDPDEPVINDALAWTRAGILYTDGTDLRAARNGHSRVVLRNAGSARISGNGRSFVTSRSIGPEHVEYVECRVDGAHCRLLARQGDPGRTAAYYDLQPDFRGRHVIATRSPGPTTADPDPSLDIVTWAVGAPASSARPLAFTGADTTVTWN